MAPAVRCHNVDSDDQQVVAGAVYGLRIAGFQDPALSGTGLKAWPLVTLSQEIGDFEPFAHRIGDEDAEVAGDLVIERNLQRAVLHVPALVPTDQLVHPTLAWIGAVFAHWRGRLGMHGGAFVSGGGAWIVLAAKGGGKSTTLAALFDAGHEILTDDLIILDEGRVLPGPRCIDLKEEPESVVGRPVAYERFGDRRRIFLPEAESAVPLAGVLLLEWGERVGLEPVPVARRLEVSIGHRTLNETDPRLLLLLAAVPMWVLRRPPVVDNLDEVAARLANLSREAGNSRGR